MTNQMFTPRFLGLILLFLTPLVSLPAATISGRVYDADNDFYVEGAVVRIEGTSRTATSGRGGSYRFAGVEPGTYELVVSPLAYPPSRRTAIVEDADADVAVDFTVSIGDAFELEEFRVEGQGVAQAKSISLRRASAELKEIVSTDAFGQFADRNPAEALQRTAGVTVQDGGQGQGEYILVRGTSPDLSSVQIDGVNLATPSEDGRQTNLNLITLDQLERVELSKTWLPTQKANVIGGTVNLVTRSALDRGELFASVEGAGTYRDIAPDERSWRSSITFGGVLDDRALDWMGDKAIGFQISVNQSEDFLGSNTISWNWEPYRDFPFLINRDGTRPQGFSLFGVNRRKYNIDRERFGGSAKLEFRLNDNHQFFASFSRNEFDDTEREHQFRNQANVQAAQFYSGTVNISPAIVAQLGLDPNDPFVASRLALPNNNTQKALTFDEAIALGEIVWDPDSHMFTNGGRWPMDMHRTYIHTFREDRIDTFQFGGEHHLWWDIDMDWSAYASEATQDEEEHWFRLNATASGTGGIPLAGPDYPNPYVLDPSGSNPALYNPAVFRQNLPNQNNIAGSFRQHNLLDTSDDRSGFDIDLEKQAFWRNLTLKTNAGISAEQREKDFHVDNNTFGYAGRSALDDFHTDRLWLQDEFFYGGEIEDWNHFGDELRFGPSFHEENTLAFLQDPAGHGVTLAQTRTQRVTNFMEQVQRNYEASEDVYAAYFQQSVEWNDWTVIAGARYERTENTFTNLSILTHNPDFPFEVIHPTRWEILDNHPEGGRSAYSEEVTHEREYDKLHPALHVIRRIGDNATVRASVSRTLARPKFTDLVPREIADVDGSNNWRASIQLPAFDLEPMESTNFDLSLDYYFQPIGMFSVAVFHKELRGAIYQEITRGVDNDLTKTLTDRYFGEGVPDRAWEVSQMRNSGDGKLTGIELTFDRKFNFLPSFWDGFGVNSNISWFESEATLLTDQRVGETVSLFHQPSRTANASIYYDKHDVFARLSFNVRGKYLNSVSGGSSVQSDADRLGLPISTFDTWVDETVRLDLTLRYKITPRLQVFFDAINLTNEASIRYMGSELRPTQKQYTDRVYTLGLKWNL